MVTDTIAKVREVKKADKSVILVGWGVAAAVNCQVKISALRRQEKVLLGCVNFTVDFRINHTTSKTDNLITNDNDY